MLKDASTSSHLLSPTDKVMAERGEVTSPGWVGSKDMLKAKYAFLKQVAFLMNASWCQVPSARVEFPRHDFNNKELKIGTFDGGEIITANNTL